MKKTLMLSAMAVFVAGSVTGCSNWCGKSCNCGEDDWVMVEAVETVDCPLCSQKHKCKTMHKHDKKCKDIKRCRPTASCQGDKCQEDKKDGKSHELDVNATACNDSGTQHNSGNTGADAQK